MSGKLKVFLGCIATFLLGSAYITLVYMRNIEIINQTLFIGDALFVLAISMVGSSIFVVVKEIIYPYLSKPQ